MQVATSFLQRTANLQLNYTIISMSDVYITLEMKVLRNIRHKTSMKKH